MKWHHLFLESVCCVLANRKGHIFGCFNEAISHSNGHHLFGRSDFWSITELIAILHSIWNVYSPFKSAILLKRLVRRTSIYRRSKSLNEPTMLCCMCHRIILMYMVLYSEICFHGWCATKSAVAPLSSLCIRIILTHIIYNLPYGTYWASSYNLFMYEAAVTHFDA